MEFWRLEDIEDYLTKIITSLGQNHEFKKPYQCGFESNWRVVLVRHHFLAKEAVTSIDLSPYKKQTESFKSGL